MIGFGEYSEGIKVKLENPDEIKTLHPDVVVKRVDAD